MFNDGQYNLGLPLIYQSRPFNVVRVYIIICKNSVKRHISDLAWCHFQTTAIRDVNFLVRAMEMDIVSNSWLPTCPRDAPGLQEALLNSSMPLLDPRHQNVLLLKYLNN